MTTSSTYSYQLTRNEIIQSALRKLGVLAEGQTPSTQNYADGSMALNTVISQLRAVGMPLWARSEYTFTPTTNTYTIGTGMTLSTPFPVKLLQAFRTDTGAKIPLEIVAREDFNILPTSSNGSPIKINYQSFVNYGIISLWPTPASSNSASITLVYQRPYQYFTTSTETMVPTQLLILSVTVFRYLLIVGVPILSILKSLSMKISGCPEASLPM